MHTATLTHVAALDPSSRLYWTCTCGAASDDDFTSPADAATHYASAHIS